MLADTTKLEKLLHLLGGCKELRKFGIINIRPTPGGEFNFSSAVGGVLDHATSAGWDGMTGGVLKW